MESVGNYWFFWTLYLGAALVFIAVFWRITRFEKAVWSAYSLRAIAIATVLTPWYSNPQESVMAPALMVAALDAITGGFEAAFRSLVPLVLSIVFALLIAGVFSFIKKKRTGKINKNNRIDDISEAS